MAPRSLARVLTDVLNPFVIFTALFFGVALAQSPLPRTLLYAGVELLAAVAVAGFVVYMRRRARVEDFWISARAERLTPAVFLLGAPTDLFLLTLSMGLASATVALLTLFFKASTHCTVAGHAATAGVLVLGPLGWIFALGLPLVIWSRVTLGAHTIPETLAGALVGAGFALLLLL